MAIIKTKEKDAYIHIRLSSSEKEKFTELCEAKALNQSAWIRQKIREFIEQNGK